MLFITSVKYMFVIQKSLLNANTVENILQESVTYMTIIQESSVGLLIKALETL